LLQVIEFAGEACQIAAVEGRDLLLTIAFAP
jgi:hypothetical protein